MSTEEKPIKRETVTLKKTIIQGETEKKPGEKVDVTPEQKKRLTATGHI